LDCHLQQAATLEQLLAWEQQLGDRAAPLRSSPLSAHVANAYAKQGVSAEDPKDSYSAVLAYRKALFWNPKDTKARFNLAAVYVGDRKFEQAEVEYRALIQADPKDHEAQYWLAESILTQRPGTEKKSEACAMLRRSLQVGDPERRSQFAVALEAAQCPN
jgi:Flp pilus assembly protein TadD